MFDVIRKREYFDWCDAKVIPNMDLLDLVRKNMPDAWFLLDIKSTEDAWILSQIGNVEGKKIAEIGGSDSRILPALRAKNECWNIDKLEGDHGGVNYRRSLEEGNKVVRAYLGEFSPELQDAYFDFVISVSVVEHVPVPAMPDFFRDMARIMKPGAMALHAVDFYISDQPEERTASVINGLLDGARSAGLELISGAQVDGNLVFRSDYASHSDMGLQAWNRSVPSLRQRRESHQVVSIKAGWRKP